jgi:NitT/TauT family transport system ATP-binding protein
VTVKAVPTVDDEETPMTTTRAAPTTRPEQEQTTPRIPDHDAAVALDRVTVAFAQADGTTRTVLRDISLDVPRGQFLVVVGMSGGGKTTILNLVAGLVRPVRGTVQVLGGDPLASRRRTGFMPARDGLLPWRNARRNVEYGMELRGVPRAERRARAQRWLEAVNLTDAGQLWPWQLSQGMRQRVALARTWALDPDVLLMDEPFAALDAVTRLSVQDEFMRLWQSEEHRTVVFVTHDLGEAITLADRIVLVGDGGIRDDVMVPFPRPRDMASLATEPVFQELLAALRSRLH